MVSNTMTTKHLGHVIAVGNQKGGVGKTTVTTHVAAALGELGRKSLIWDLDGNRGASVWFNIPTSYLGTFEVITGQENPADVILHTDEEEGLAFPKGVSLLSCRRNLETLEAQLRQNDKWGNPDDCLKASLTTLREEYDYIFLDTAPNSYAATRAAYLGADWFLLSALPNRLSLEGLTEAMDDILAVRERGNPKLRLLGIVLSAIDRRTRIGNEILRTVKEEFSAAGLFGAFQTSISRAIIVDNAIDVGKTVFDISPSHKIAEQYRLLAREVENRIAASADEGASATEERVANA